MAGPNSPGSWRRWRLSPHSLSVSRFVQNRRPPAANPTGTDLRALALDPDDIKALKTCREGACDVQVGILQEVLPQARPFA
jgi:hypothetical protein